MTIQRLGRDANGNVSQGSLMTKHRISRAPTAVPNLESRNLGFGGYILRFARLVEASLIDIAGHVRQGESRWFATCKATFVLFPEHPVGEEDFQAERR